MVWVRIDDRFDEHPKVSRVGPLGMAMHVAALCYCNRNLTDGFVPRAVAKRLVDIEGVMVDDEPIDWWWVVKALLDAGMWANEDGGYRIHDFHDFQPSKAYVEEQRAKTAERVKRHRERKRNEAGNTVTNALVTPAPEPGPEPTNPTTPLPPQAGDERSKLRAVGANPRALGTNPRAVAKRQRDEARKAYEVGTPEYDERAREERERREGLAGM